MMEFEINDRQFRAEKLNVFNQGHLSRKLAPLLPPMADIVDRALTDLKRLKPEGLLDLPVTEYLAIAQPFANALSEMKREDFEEVLNITLGSVQVQTGAGTWMPLWVKSTGLTMLEDLNSFGKMLPLIIKVVYYNLGDFTEGLRTRRSESLPERPNGAPSQAARIGS
jgi:hypothetical protein